MPELLGELDGLWRQPRGFDDRLVGHSPHEDLCLLADLVWLKVPVVDDAGGDDGDLVGVAVVAVVLPGVTAHLGRPENGS